MAPRLRADARRNREHLLQIARSQLLVGDTSLTMNHLARLANVGVGTVYRHFPTRQSLLEALASDGFMLLTAAVDRAAGHADPTLGVEELLRSVLHYQLEDPALAVVMASSDLELPETHGHYTRLLRVSAELFARAQARGGLRPDVSPDDVRRLLTGLVTAVRAGAFDAGLIERYLDVLLKGLHPPLA